MSASVRAARARRPTTRRRSRRRPDSIFAGIAPFTVDTAAGNDPTQDLDGSATPRTKSVTRLRTLTGILSNAALQQPLRQEKAELDFATTRRRPPRAAPRSPRETRSRSASPFDERGDIKEVRLYAGDQLVKAKRSFPFQFRYDPATAQVGRTLTLRAEAEDAGGRTSRRSRVTCGSSPAKCRTVTVKR